MANLTNNGLTATDLDPADMGMLRLIRLDSLAHTWSGRLEPSETMAGLTADCAVIDRSIDSESRCIQRLVRRAAAAVARRLR